MISNLNTNTHIFFNKNSKIKNYLAAIAIGSKHFKDWKKYAYPSWKAYCKKNNLGIIIIKKDLINKKSFFWKKPTWQRLLIGQYIRENNINISNICVLDTDIFINNLSPNIFKVSNLNKISVVHLHKNLPHSQSDYKLRERLVYLRRYFLNYSYPLRSSITAKPIEIYKNYNLKNSSNDYFQAGVMVYDVNKHYKLLYKIYLKYCSVINKKKFRGVEIPLNHELTKNTRKLHWLDYKFQTIWLYELADKYSFLYRVKKNYKEIKKYCAEEIILNSYFLHFAGTFKDAAKVWKIDNFFSDKKLMKLNLAFNSKQKKLKPKFKK